MRQQRWGLRAKMTASYLLVTAAAVLVVEIVAIVLAQSLLAPTADASRPVQLTAENYAATVIDANARLGRLPTAEEIQLGDPALSAVPDQALLANDKVSARIPVATTVQDEARPMSLALLLDADLRIVATSYAARYPVGARVGGPGTGVLPVDTIIDSSHLGGRTGGQSKVSNGTVLWAVAPVLNVATGLDSKGPGAKDGKAGEDGKEAAIEPLGVVYVQVPATAGFTDHVPPADSGSARLLWIGVVVLLGALPVGVVFGLLATRSLIRRLRQLAASTVAVADGQYHHRIPVTGTDEIAKLEGNFNRMAAQLADAMVAERQLASAGERARIARELHDSISQDLFSLRLLAGGLRRALPATSPLSPQIEAMERTATGTMHEMQALLLELRPIALQDAGLIPTLTELCRAYSDRLGVTVDAELEPVVLDPAVEHAVLRIIQEALANAVKHAQPTRITVRVHPVSHQVEVSVTDNGTGFDPTRVADRHGMGLELMRERVTELGGTLSLTSTPGEGTSVRITLDRRLP